jgi:hypothetical protein
MDVLDQCDIFDNSELLTILQTIMNDDDWKTTICSKSYLHVNNFYKINLGTQKDGTTIRLHYWNKNTEYGQNPHSHGWNFTSKVIRGVLFETRYEQCEEKGGFMAKFQQDLTKHNKTSSIIEKEDDLRLRIIDKSWYNVDYIYSADTDVIHTAYAGEDKTITAIKQSPFLKDTCDIYASEPIEGSSKRENISIEQLNAMLCDVILYLLDL